MTEDIPESNAERPLECGKCKKPIKVLYTEIIGNSIVRTSMCADCPELLRHLRGIESGDKSTGQLEGVADLCCGNCGTTLEEIKRGHFLGCEECYNIFGDILISELLAANKLPSRLVNVKKSVPIHIGRTPGEPFTINVASRLLALNEALSETLRREDYEQAALLRDQIRDLTEKEKSGKNKNSKKEEKKS